MISTALRKSESGLLEISKDGVYTRRTPEKPLPENTEERRSEETNRTVYAKGFPQNVSLDKLLTYFETSHGPVESVFMRRDPNRKFKGSVFTTFKSQESADKFLQSTGLKYDEKSETDLIIMTKVKYFEKKQEEKKKIRAEKIQQKKEELKKKEEEDRQRAIDTMSKGAILHMSGFKEDTQREDIKTYFIDYGGVQWVDFDMGDKEAMVRFEEAGKAVTALQMAKAANDDKVVIKETELECRVLEGEEEILHWIKIFKEAAERKAEQKKAKKRKHGGRDRDDHDRHDRHGHRDKRRRDDRRDDRRHDHSDDD